MDEEKQRESSNNVKWIIGILVVIIVLLGSALFLAISGEALIILDYLSVSSQVASIVLAIVAIVFAFTESQKSGMHFSNLQNLLHEINFKIAEYAKISNYAIQSIGELKTELGETSDKSNEENKNEVSAILDKYTKRFEDLENYTTSSIESDAEKLGSMFKLNKKFGIDSTLGANTVANFVTRKSKK